MPPEKDPNPLVTKLLARALRRQAFMTEDPDDRKTMFERALRRERAADAALKSMKGTDDD